MRKRLIKKESSDVDTLLRRETDHVKKALESASRYFDGNDNLTVNTLEAAGATKSKANETRQYVENVPIYESEFASKSSTDKNIKQKEPRKEKYRCTEGHWVTIDDRPVFICD